MTPRLFSLVVGLALIGLVWLSVAWIRRGPLSRSASWVIVVVVWVILILLYDQANQAGLWPRWSH